MYKFNSWKANTSPKTWEGWEGSEDHWISASFFLILGKALWFLSESFFLDVSISQLHAQKAEGILDSCLAFCDWAIQS